MTDILKWAFSFYIVTITIGWAVFTVLIVKSCMATPSTISVVEASGVSVLMGGLITWSGLIIQHWFRKKNAEEGK